MKGQDIVVLLKLISIEQAGFEQEKPLDERLYSVRGLAVELGISKSEINASINRSVSAGLARNGPRAGQINPNRRSLYNFIVHGLKFVFPPKSGAMTRGIPTGFDAPPLRKLLISAGEDLHVWPYAQGKTKGQSLDPLFKSVPEAAQKDNRLYEYLAAIDAIRLGNQREAGLAAEHLSKRLLSK